MTSLRAVAATMLLALSIVACTDGAPHTGTEVRVGAGVFGTRGWTSWAYRSMDSGLCLQIRLESGDTTELCGIDTNGTSTWRPEGPDGTFVAGTSADPRGVAARVTLADGSELLAPVVPATDVTNLGFYVIPVPTGPEPAVLDILDGDDAVIGSIPLD